MHLPVRPLKGLDVAESPAHFRSIPILVLVAASFLLQVVAGLDVEVELLKAVDLLRGALAESPVS